MKFLILVIDTSSNSGSKEELIHINSFNERLQRGNHWIMAAGIGSSATALLIDNRDGAMTFSPSSLNGNEFYSGFWIIQADNEEVAKSLAFEASLACNRKVELRPFLGH